MIVINICLKFDHLFIACPVHYIMQNRQGPFKLDPGESLLLYIMRVLGLAGLQ